MGRCSAPGQPRWARAPPLEASPARRVQHGRAGDQAAPGVLTVLGKSCNLAFDGADGDRQGKSSRLSNKIHSASLTK